MSSDVKPQEGTQRFEDLTHRLRSTLGKMELALAEISESIAWTDGDRRIRWCNSSFDRLVDRPHLTILGKDLAAALPLTRSGLPIEADDHPVALAIAGNRAVDEPFEYQTPAGTRLLSISWSTLPTEESAVIAIRDVTAQKTMEVRLRQAEKLESIGQLAAGIAHEINTPMQYISGNIDYIRSTFAKLASAIEQIPDAHTPAVEKALTRVPGAIEDAASGVARVTEIVSAMGQLSHPGSTTMQQGDLNEIIRQSVTVSSGQWKMAAHVEFDLGDDLPPIDCLPGELGQVVLNLVVNAAQAIAADGDSGPLGEIRIASRRDGDHMLLSIADSGPGIPESIRSRVFDPFFTTKEVGSGTGQGLALVYRVVTELHAGEVWFDVGPTGGTTFWVRLPIERNVTEHAA